MIISKVLIMHMKLHMTSFKLRGAKVPYSKLANVITYSSLITSSANGGKTEEAFDIFNSMLAAGVKANVIPQNSLITAYAIGAQSRVWHFRCHKSLQ